MPRLAVLKTQPWRRQPVPDHLHLKCILDEGIPALPSPLGSATLQPVWKSEMPETAKAFLPFNSCFFGDLPSQLPLTASTQGLAHSF